MRGPLWRLALLAGLAGVPGALPAQSRADSAAIVLEAARALREAGQAAAARELLRFISTRYGGTPAGLTADSILRESFANESLTRGTGRTGFVLFHTIYGGFLGVAIPGAFGAEGSGPYGAGLLIGGPLGFISSRAFARARITMPGQAAAASFATFWGTWNGLALQRVFHIGEEKRCLNNGECHYYRDSDSAPWAMMAVGGFAGLGTGLALTSREIPSGTASLVSAGAFWGTWFGLAGAGLAGVEDDGLTAAALIGGDAALVAAIPIARSWRPVSSRVQLATAAGIAGGLAGLGIDLLAEIEGQEAFAAPLAGSALGLVIGAAVARSSRDSGEEDGAALALALLTVKGKPRLGIPVPVPAALPSDREAIRPGFKLLLVDAVF